MRHAIYRDPRWAIGLSLAFTVLSFPILARVWFDYLGGGNGWRQGDWLINFGAGIVRRGAIGELLITLSDWTSLPLLVVVLTVQVALFIGLVLVIWSIFILCRDKQLVLLLIASPAFFLTFWASDLQGTMRKELLGYLALGLLTLTSLLGGRQVFLAILAVVFFCLGCMGNIMHVMMGPALAIALWLARDASQISNRLFLILLAAITVMGVFWLGFAVKFKEVPELASMCEPLLARGFNDHICQDAIRWLVTNQVDHLEQVQGKITSSAIIHYAIAAIPVLIPAFLVLATFREKWTLAIFILGTFIAMLPLYLIATDWGRWLSMSYMFFMFLTIQAHTTGRLTLVWLPPRALIYGLIIVSLVISQTHTIGWLPGGIVRSIAQTFRDFL